jgi:hypothetical protein
MPQELFLDKILDVDKVSFIHNRYLWICIELSTGCFAL